VIGPARAPTPVGSGPFAVLGPCPLVAPKVARTAQDGPRLAPGCQGGPRVAPGCQGGPRVQGWPQAGPRVPGVPRGAQGARVTDREIFS